MVGAAGLVTLGLMYAIEVPSGGPFRFGAINDLCGAAFSALLIPVAARVARRAPPSRGFAALTRVTYASAVAGAVLPLLLVGNVLPFEVETPLVVACIELQSLWLLALGRRLRDVPELARFGRLSRLVGGSFLAGTAIALAGLAFPWLSVPQIAVWVVAGIVGGAGYLGWPLWFHAAARALRTGASS